MHYAYTELGIIAYSMITPSVWYLCGPVGLFGLNSSLGGRNYDAPECSEFQTVWLLCGRAVTYCAFFPLNTYIIFCTPAPGWVLPWFSDASYDLIGNALDHANRHIWWVAVTEWHSSVITYKPLPEMSKVCNKLPEWVLDFQITR